MFRDDRQAVRALRALLATIDFESLWNEQGPTPCAVALLDAEDAVLGRSERALLRVCFLLWDGRKGGVRVEKLVALLDAGPMEALCSMLLAAKNGPQALDAWVASHAAAPEVRVAIPPARESWVEVRDSWIEVGRTG